MVEQYKRKPNIECLICKKLIYRRPYEIEKTKGRVFCSASCYGISCRNENFCIVCGKAILARFNKKTCSRSCANKNRVGIFYKMNRPRDKVTTQKAIKTQVLKIKGKNCERCGYDKYEILQLHHKNRNRDDNSIENLEIICPNCHYEEHHLNHFKKD